MSSRVGVQQGEPANVEPAEGDLAMRVAVEEREPLSRAMSELTEGDSRRFCDSMWLGFGDRWKRVLKDLTDGGFVAVLDQECNAVSYTHLRAHETPEHLVCRLLLEKK